MNENMDIAIKVFAGWLNLNPQYEVKIGTVIFEIAKENDLAPRDVHKAIVKRLRDG